VGRVLSQAVGISQTRHAADSHRNASISGDPELKIIA